MSERIALRALHATQTEAKLAAIKSGPKPVAGVPYKKVVARARLAEKMGKPSLRGA